jgi:hypothetical protein
VMPCGHLEDVVVIVNERAYLSRAGDLHEVSGSPDDTLPASATAASQRSSPCARGVLVQFICWTHESHVFPRTPAARTSEPSARDSRRPPSAETTGLAGAALPEDAARMSPGSR